jgi:hypothetical protein
LLWQTFQERVLSRRILRFGRDRMSWQCCKYDAAEDNRWPSLRKSIQGPISLSRIRLSVTGIFQLWRLIVTDYSKRKLSFQVDRLPAISGIARVLSQKLEAQYKNEQKSDKTKSGRDGVRLIRETDHAIEHEIEDQSHIEYIAGLWQQDLSNGLCWHSCSVRQTILSEEITAKGPSWSWASWNQPVAWRWQEKGGSESVWSMKGQMTARHGEPDNFGRVSSATIVVLSCKVSYLAVTNDSMMNSERTTAVIVWPDGRTHHVGEAALDMLPRHRGKYVTWVPVMLVRYREVGEHEDESFGVAKGEEWHWEALMLENTGTDPSMRQFQRIGLAFGRWRGETVKKCFFQGDHLEDICLT